MSTSPLAFRIWNKIARRYQPAGMYALTGEGELMARDERWEWESDSTPLDRTCVVVERFTGLTDKNSKDIYHLDIVRIYEEINEPTGDNGRVRHEWRGLISRVGFQDGCFVIRLKAGDGLKQLGRYVVEVIGNMNENRELLTQ